MLCKLYTYCVKFYTYCGNSRCFVGNLSLFRFTRFRVKSWPENFGRVKVLTNIMSVKNTRLCFNHTNTVETNQMINSDQNIITILPNFVEFIKT